MFNLYEGVMPYGNHYDFLADREAEISLERAVALNEGLNHPKEEERTRTRLADVLSSVIGFRKANELAKQSTVHIQQFLADESQRRGKARADLERIIGLAARNIARKYPREFAQTEIKRDSYHYFGMRSGLIGIYNLLHGTKLTPEGFSQALLDGRNLTEVISDARVLDVSRVLPSAILYSQDRKRLEDALRQWGLGDVEVHSVMKVVPYAPAVGNAISELSIALGKNKEDIQEALVKCFTTRDRFEKQFQQFADRISLPEREVGKAREILLKSIKGIGHKLDIIQAFDDIRLGLPIEYLLVDYYKAIRLYPLAASVTDFVGLNPRLKMHTRIAAVNTAMYVNHLTGNAAIPRKLLMFLYQEAEEYKRGSVTSWSTKNPNRIFYPNYEISYEALGTLFGAFFLGHGYKSTVATKLYYQAGRRSVDNIIDIMELVGSLERRPLVTETFCSSKDLELLRGRPFCFDDERTYTNKRLGVPSQFSHVIDMVIDRLDEFSQNTDFCRATLKAWLFEKSWTSNPRNGTVAAMSTGSRLGYNISQQYTVEKLAKAVGLGITEGRTQGNLRTTSVLNPEVVGFTP